MTDTPEPKKEKPKAKRLNPVITLDAKFFWDHAKKHEFVCQQCSDCREFRFPPRPMCPHCHSVEREIVELSGKGSVHSFVRPTHPKAVGFDTPPIAAVIDVEEGFRFVSNLVEVEWEKIEVGMAVEVTFAETMGKKAVPVFRPADPALRTAEEA